MCVNSPGSYKCVCKPGFSGQNCETNVDNCKSKPCDSERSTGCADKENDYYCRCFKGWEGKNCTQSMYNGPPVLFLIKYGITTSINSYLFAVELVCNFMNIRLQ